jgi:Uma2 family endonuclease
VFNAPIDVILIPHDAVQPDLVVVTDPGRVSGRGIEGPPALVVEVLSPPTADYDRTTKARRCAAPGILHFWLVDPDARTLASSQREVEAYTVVARGEGPLRSSVATGPTSRCRSPTSGAEPPPAHRHPTTRPRTASATSPTSVVE